MLDIRSYSLISHAIRFATEAHADHKRDDGAPYVSHLARVAALTAVQTDDPALIAAAWLHDTVEDVGVSWKDLWDAGFTEDVVTVVFSLTKTPEMEADKENGPVDAIRKVERGVKGAILVKLADRLDNLRDGRRTHGERYVTKPSRMRSTRALVEAAFRNGITCLSNPVVDELLTIIKEADPEYTVGPNAVNA